MNVNKNNCNIPPGAFEFRWALAQKYIRAMHIPDVRQTQLSSKGVLTQLVAARSRHQLGSCLALLNISGHKATQKHKRVSKFSLAHDSISVPGLSEPEFPGINTQAAMPRSAQTIAPMN